MHDRTGDQISLKEVSEKVDTHLSQANYNEALATLSGFILNKSCQKEADTIHFILSSVHMIFRINQDIPGEIAYLKRYAHLLDRSPVFNRKLAELHIEEHEYAHALLAADKAVDHSVSIDDVVQSCNLKIIALAHTDPLKALNLFKILLSRLPEWQTKYWLYNLDVIEHLMPCNEAHSDMLTYLDCIKNPAMLRRPISKRGFSALKMKLKH